MLKNHPKGLLSASLANLGERFGFYTMMAILILFLQAKFGLGGKDAGLIYSIFYFSIYILAFVGGLIADKIQNYKKTIFVGLFIMLLGYGILAIPTPTPVPNKTLYLFFSCFALFIIAFGNGLFKGNLQALIGQMYDNPEYSKYRDSGFSLFYMFINIGSIFAPLAAVFIRNSWVSSHGFSYNAALPDLCHQLLSGTLKDSGKLLELATQVSKNQVTDLNSFATDYLNVFTTGFHYAFAAAILAIIVSIVIYFKNQHKYPNVQKKANSNNNSKVTEMDIKETKQRIYALIAVYCVVIFFWFSFHQNGVALTLFAKDYTILKIFGINIAAETFQSINPFFVVAFTPLVMMLFTHLRKKNIEPSTPKKIAIGMFIAAGAYILMLFGSLGLPLHSEVVELGILPDIQRATPWLLVGTYFLLTMAELFISPLGISFVSKVSPPKYQGLMQGGWLGATALGNQLLFIGVIMYENIPLWITWGVFVIVCLMSMGLMLIMLKWLEKVAR